MCYSENNITMQENIPKILKYPYFLCKKWNFLAFNCVVKYSWDSSTRSFLKSLAVVATGSAVAQAFMKILALKAGRRCSCQELLLLHPSSPRAFYSSRSISWTRGRQALINTSLLFFLLLYLNLCLRKNDKTNSGLFVLIFTAWNWILPPFHHKWEVQGAEESKEREKENNTMLENSGSWENRKNDINTGKTIFIN